MLYFDVVGDIPNSVVFNDGTRDLLAWVPGDPPGSTAAPVVVPDSDENFQVVPDNQASAGAPPPSDNNSAIVATPPNDLATSPYQITEGEAAQPGFNSGGGHR